MVSKSQEASEQPAKVYQLDAIVKQVDNLALQMEKGFTKVDASVSALLLKSESQVTPQQLNDNINALKSSMSNALDEEVKKIHLTYGPLKENIKWLIRAIAAQGIIIVGQIIIALFMKNTG